PNAYLIYHHFFRLLERLINDEQDTIRVLAAEQLFRVIDLIHSDFTDKGKEALILPLVTASLEDKSWRVRTVHTNILIKFNKIFPEVLFNQVACCKFLEYLRDSENEVKVRALNNLSDFIETIPESERETFILDEIIPKIHSLMNSKHVQVKIALSKCVISLSKYLSQTELTSNLLSLYMILLRDDNSEISLATISKLCEVKSDNISMKELFSCIFDAISELSRDSKWRVRDDIVKLLPSVITSIKFDDEGSEQLIKTLIKMLNDNVYAIRRSVADSIFTLVSKQGLQWANNTVIPMINEMKDSHNYIVRMAYIDNVDLLLDSLDSEAILDIFKSLKLVSKDPVPNVRFRLIRFFKDRLYPFAVASDDEKHKEMSNEIIQIVKSLANDQDNDVRDFVVDFEEKYSA
ncbi:MAG: protein phosphatase 2, regulatory subunit A, partial [Marteilia pararefringens]